MFGYSTFFNSEQKTNSFNGARTFYRTPLADEYEALEIFLIMAGFGILFFSTQINFHCLHNYIAWKDVLFSGKASNRERARRKNKFYSFHNLKGGSRREKEKRLSTWWFFLWKKFDT